MYSCSDTSVTDILERINYRQFLVETILNVWKIYFPVRFSMMHFVLYFDYGIANKPVSIPIMTVYDYTSSIEQLPKVQKS